MPHRLSLDNSTFGAKEKSEAPVPILFHLIRRNRKNPLIRINWKNTRLYQTLLTIQTRRHFHLEPVCFGSGHKERKHRVLFNAFPFHCRFLSSSSRMADFYTRPYSPNYSGLINQAGFGGFLLALCWTGYELMRSARRHRQREVGWRWKWREPLGSVESWEFG